MALSPLIAVGRSVSSQYVSTFVIDSMHDFLSTSNPFFLSADTAEANASLIPRTLTTALEERRSIEVSPAMLPTMQVMATSNGKNGLTPNEHFRSERKWVEQALSIDCLHVFAFAWGRICQAGCTPVLSDDMRNGVVETALTCLGPQPPSDEDCGEKLPPDLKRWEALRKTGLLTV